MDLQNVNFPCSLQMNKKLEIFGKLGLAMLEECSMTPEVPTLVRTF